MPMTDWPAILAIAFEDPRQGFAARAAVLALQREFRLDLADIAVATRDRAGRLRLHRAPGAATMGALGGACWGLLAGLPWHWPLSGMAGGATLGAWCGWRAGLGLEQRWLRAEAATLAPGASALFLAVRRVDSLPFLTTMASAAAGGRLWIAPANDRLINTLRAALAGQYGEYG